jgi:hypothetical protein
MIKKIVEVIVGVIDRTLGMVVGAIGGAVMGILFWGIPWLHAVWKDDPSTFFQPLLLLLIFFPVISFNAVVSLLLLLPMFVLGLSCAGGIFCGICLGLVEGLSGLIISINPWQEQQPSPRRSQSYQVEDRFYGAVGDQPVFFPQQLYLPAAIQTPTLLQKVQNIKASPEARQYIEAMITQEELAEFKNIIDAKLDAAVKKSDQALYDLLNSECVITYNTLLDKNNPPITVRKKTKGEEGRAFFSTYNYFAFLNYLMNDQGQEPINDPFLQVPLDSEEITFFIGFPNVSKKDFVYIREQLSKKVASSPSASTERAAELSRSSRVSDAQEALFYHPLASHVEGAPESRRLFTFTFNAPGQNTGAG